MNKPTFEVIRKPLIATSLAVTILMGSIAIYNEREIDLSQNCNNGKYRATCELGDLNTTTLLRVHVPGSVSDTITF